MAQRQLHQPVRHLARPWRHPDRAHSLIRLKVWILARHEGGAAPSLMLE
jgi:hypothetical protein